MHLSSTVAQVLRIYFRFNLVQFLAQNRKICFHDQLLLLYVPVMISDLTNVDQQLLICAIG